MTSYLLSSLVLSPHSLSLTHTHTHTHAHTHTLSLFVEKLPKHPGYSKVTPADKTRVNKLLNPAFERALELKKKLKEKFEQERDEHVTKMETEVRQHGCLYMYGIVMCQRRLEALIFSHVTCGL